MGKDNTRAVSEDRIPLVFDRHGENGNITSRGKNEQRNNELSRCAEGKISYGERTGQFDRETNVMYVSSSPSTLTLPSPSNAECSRVAEEPKLRKPSSFGPSEQRRNRMVDKFVMVDKWQKPTNEKERYRSDERCIEQGMGCLVRVPKDRVVLESRGERMAYKRQRVENGVNDNKDLQSQGSPHNLAHGQHYSSSANKQKNQSKVQASIRSYAGDLGVLLRTTEHDYCSIPSGTTESGSRLVIQGMGGFKRLEIRRDSIQTSGGDDGTSQLEQYVSWKQDTEAMAVDSFQMEWGTVEGYAFPPFCLIGRVLQKVWKEEATITIITPVGPAQTWYSTLLYVSIQEPVLLPQTKRLLRNAKNELHPLTQQMTLKLAAWRVSGKEQQARVFRRSLQTYSWQNGERVERFLTSPSGANGVAGVVDEALIRFRQLYHL